MNTLKIMIKATIIYNVFLWLRKIWRNMFSVNVLRAKDGISLVRSKKSSLSYFFPYDGIFRVDSTQIMILDKGYHLHLQKKYSNPDCRVLPGDTVVDCGGFVGGFSIAANKMVAERVLHVEPTPITQYCAKLNFALHGVDNVECINIGLGDKDTVKKLNLSRSFADNSFLTPDDGTTFGVIDVQSKTIDTLAKECGLVSTKTFFKVEAEGFEVEILNGMNSFFPNRIVVDVSPERDGLSPADEISVILRNKNYDIIENNGSCLFAFLR